MYQHSDYEGLETPADIFKVFSSDLRMDILTVLNGQELSVKEITDKVQSTQTAVSKSLSVLKNIWLVRYREEGREVYYTLNKKVARTLLEEATGCHLKKKEEGETND